MIRHVFISASLKNRVEATADTAKPVPRAERSARLQGLRAKYTGLDISKALEPGHAMLDSTSHQAESKILKYMPPSRCASREQEMMSNKSSAKLLEIEGSQLKVKENDKGLFIENNTEFLVYQALRRPASHTSSQILSPTRCTNDGWIGSSQSSPKSNPQDSRRCKCSRF